MNPSAAQLRIQHGLSPQEIHLSSLVIHKAISRCGALYTAIIASLLLDQSGMSIDQVPQNVWSTQHLGWATQPNIMEAEGVL
jgi:hypothetical protein